MMPRTPRPQASTPPPNNGNDAEPPSVDISEMQTGLLASPTSRARLLEEMAAAHDADAARLAAWRDQIASWLDVAYPALVPAWRRLRWLRSEPRLSRVEAHERDTLAAWLNAKQREISDAEAARTSLTAEIAEHLAAAVRLRGQKGERTGDHGKDPPPQEPEGSGKA